MRLLIHSARQVVADGLQVLEDEGGLAIATDSNGCIAAVDTNEAVRSTWPDTEFEEVLDASGLCVLPGFVDAHTHPVWSGERVNEFIMKLSGATYLEIHQSGGGIFSTVRSTVAASEDELFQSLKERLTQMMRAGTTLVECKSGYGLEAEAEFKLLHVLERAKRELPIELSITFCGAHAVPQGSTAEEATDNIVREQIPRLHHLMQDGILSVENVDVFCERGVFDVAQSRRILATGQAIGLRGNFHGEELHVLGSAEMGAELGVAAISHLEEVSDAGIQAMAKAGTVAVILPTTAFFLHLKPPPVRKMLATGVTVALGSDFNPNAHCLAMPVVMSLACTTLGMSVQEALTAATLNAATSLGRAETHGSIKLGKRADFVLVRATRWEHIIYQFGMHHDLIDAVIKSGWVVYKKER